METPVSEVFHEFIEGIGLSIANLPGQVGVDRGSFGAVVTEIVLNQTQVNASFHQMGRVAMPQRVHVRVFGNAGFLPCPVKGALQARAGDRADFLVQALADATAGWRGKQPFSRPVRLPELAQQTQRAFRQRDVAIPLALAVNEKDHPRTIDVGDLELRPLHKPESATVDRRQTHAVDGNADFGQNAPYFFTAQDDR